MRWRRAAVLVALAAVLLGGAAWYLIDLRNAEPQFAVVSSQSSVLGTWKIEDGSAGQIEFAANGRFSAVELPVDTSPGTGLLTGAGSWSLDDRRGSVILTPDDAPSDLGLDAPRLAVVRADDRVRLCVFSGSPGVLCDFLLRPEL